MLHPCVSYTRLTHHLNGMDRYYFLPFIDLLQRHCISHDMASTTDYRRETSVNFPSYYFTAKRGDNGTTRSVSPEQIDALVKEMRGNVSSASCSSGRVLSLGHSRSLTLQDADEQGKLVRVSFDELCNRELGATDYRILAYQFQRVVILGASHKKVFLYK